MVLGKNDLNNYLTQYKHCKNVTYIYNPIAVDTSESTPLTQKRAIAVGRLSRQKGFDMLVEAWALIEKEVPDWKLDIYGQGPLQKELQGQIDGLGLRNIELKGFSDDIHSRYANIQMANQKNVLYALGALYLLEMKYLSKIATSNEPDVPNKKSELFELDNWTYHYTPMGEMFACIEGEVCQLDDEN